MYRPIAPRVCVPCREPGTVGAPDTLWPLTNHDPSLRRTCEYDALDSPQASVTPPPSEDAVDADRGKENDASSPLLFGCCPITDGWDKSITSQLSRLVGDVPQVRDNAVKYFASIHLWYPVLTECSYYESLPGTFVNPRAEYSLLNLSMALIVTHLSDPKATDLYRAAKTSIALTEAADVHSLEVVQARLLVTLFEVGNGLENAGYISIAATARAAACISINQRGGRNSHDSLLCERVWWGIVLLDRCHAIGTGKPLITQDLGSPDFLPRDGSIWDKRVLSSSEPLPMSTPKNIRVGPFARQAQVSHVVNLLLFHLRNPPLDMEEAEQIVRTLRAFEKLLPEETPQPWPRYCGALGMCYTALLTLHKSTPTSPETLQATLQGIKRIQTVFNSKVSQVDIEGLSPFAAHSVYLAALENERLFLETGNVDYSIARNGLLEMLRIFASRWGNAKNYLAIIGANSPSSTSISP
ncbi:hypothetical protein BP6252_04126 [Coleophoma cylindrospora]|uniref:Xylanolytic transcriptional activator regulatory domain-containing protein n=1 Tax=Coleophoma cylindrospora TaxID=1849047 RepID=A0A3D8RZP2_9HELO|nr:hypothetical protein BP6252_04126 [Coleophoma cylindrospora]